MPTTTYEPIATTTLGSNSSTITFTSIPSTYTDIILVLHSKSANSINNDGLSITVGNGSLDTGSNYSSTLVYNNNAGSTFSYRFSNSTSCEIGLIYDTYSPAIIHFQNYSNTTTYKTFLGRTGSPGGSTSVIRQTAGLWRSTAAINTIRLTHGGQEFISGTTATLYGIAAGAAYPPAAKATGGTITYGIGYTYHTFTSSGTFTPSQNLTADVLVIAGGGGGGSDKGGGGGAGGVCYQAGRLLTASTALTCTVGAGGAGGTSGQKGVTGGNSVFDTITSLGGGGGGGDNGGGGGYRDGVSGGSGGGPSRNGSIGSTTQGNSGGATGYGNNSGSGNEGTGSIYAGGGGGGAGAVGSNSPTSGTTMASGGAGLNTWSSWASVTSTGVSGYYAGGGGAGGYGSSDLTGGTGGAGGGGNAGSGNGGQAGSNAVANTGSGGGASSNTTSVAGGAGGSGIVIVRYAN